MWLDVEEVDGWLDASVVTARRTSASLISCLASLRIRDVTALFD
jgi:hypothetical protein